MRILQRPSLVVAGLLAFFAGLPVAEAQHDGDIAVVASGNTLHALGDFETPIVVKQGFCAGGLCLYSATDPGLVSPSEVAPPYVAVAGGTALRLEIVAVESGASVKIGANVLDAAGESAPLGTAPSVHVHPSWQLTAAMGAAKQSSLSFRITAPSGPYLPSPPFTVLLSTTAVTATTTTSSSSTTTSTETTTTSTSLPPGGYCGDGQVDAEDGEECDNGAVNGTKGTACRSDCSWTGCGDVDHSGSITAGDALHVLRVAVGTTSCDACVCDARVSLAAQISVADAQHVLRLAVGHAVELQCPSCP